MIAIIAGSSREDSNTRRVARHLAGTYGKLGEEAELLDLGELPAEAFLPGAYGQKPDGLQERFIGRVLAADGLHIVVPEYNGSFPGILKHFIDLLPYPESFECRPVAFVGVAAGYYGGLRPVEQLQMVFAYRNAYLFNRRVFIPSVYRIFDDEGAIQDADLAGRLELQAAKFLAFAAALKGIG